MSMECPGYGTLKTLASRNLPAARTMSLIVTRKSTVSVTCLMTSDVSVPSSPSSSSEYFTGHSSNSQYLWMLSLVQIIYAPFQMHVQNTKFLIRLPTLGSDQLSCIDLAV